MLRIKKQPAAADALHRPITILNHERGPMAVFCHTAPPDRLLAVENLQIDSR